MGAIYQAIRLLDHYKMSTEVETDQGTSIELLKRVDDPHHSDIVFCCKDGVKVFACRKLLAARSSYFRKMLLNGKTEFRSDFYSMPMIESSVMIIVMKFLYTGLPNDDEIFGEDSLQGGGASSTHGRGRAEICVKDNCEFVKLNWKLLLKVVDGARKLEVGRLKHDIINRVRALLPKEGFHGENTLNHVARTLSTVCEYTTVWTDGSEGTFIEEACLSMVKILIAHALSPTTLFHLSEEAFQYYLAESLRPAEDMLWEWSLDEYLRLRDILTWCAVHTVSGISSSEILDRDCLPGPEIAVAFLESCEGSRQDCRKVKFDFSRGRMKFENNLSKKVLKPLLDSVDLACVHPELLLRVIEPLRIIEPVELSMVLGLSAMKGSRRLRKNAKHQNPNVWQLINPKGELWRTPTSDSLTLAVSVQRELEVVKVKAFARVQMQSSGDCEWEIIATPHGLVGQQDLAGFEVGFYRLLDGERFDLHGDNSMWLSEDPRGSAMKICGDLQSAQFSIKESNICWRLDQDTKFKWNSPINVKLNRVATTCSFSYGGNRITLRNNGIEKGHFYPAVDFVVRGSGDRLLRPHYDYLTFQIKIVRGFNDATTYAHPELLRNGDGRASAKV